MKIYQRVALTPAVVQRFQSVMQLAVNTNRHTISPAPELQRANSCHMRNNNVKSSPNEIDIPIISTAKITANANPKVPTIIDRVTISK